MILLWGNAVPSCCPRAYELVMFKSCGITSLLGGVERCQRRFPGIHVMNGIPRKSGAKSDLIRISKHWKITWVVGWWLLRIQTRLRSGVPQTHTRHTKNYMHQQRFQASILVWWAMMVSWLTRYEPLDMNFSNSTQASRRYWEGLAEQVTLIYWKVSVLPAKMMIPLKWTGYNGMNQQSIWVNYNDLSEPRCGLTGIMVSAGNHLVIAFLQVG